MRDMGARGGGGNCGAARVGKKIQHLYRALLQNAFLPPALPFLPDLFCAPVPVYRLLRKETGVFETERLQMEGQIPVVDAPLPGKIEKLPFAASPAAPVVMRIGMFPPLVLVFCGPDYLRIRADQKKAAPTLQLFSLRRIQNLIILPLIRKPHIRNPFYTNLP